MGFIRKFFRNIVIFLVAGLFSFAILFIIKNPDFLQASVLNASEISTIQHNDRDIAYKQNENLLDIFFGKSLSQEPITLVLGHTPDISLEGATFSGQCPFVLDNISQGSTRITLTCSGVDTTQSVFLIPFSGQKKDILLEEAFYTNTPINTLSIGNLSTTTQHN